MLHIIEKNWATDLSDQLKNGTWIIGTELRRDITPSYTNIASVLDQLIYCDKEEVLA